MKDTVVQQHTKRILVPIDFSEQSIKALEQAFELARMISAELVLLSVIEDPKRMSKLMGQKLDVDKATNDVLTKLDEVFTRFNDKKVKMEPMVGRGHVADEIVRVADMLAPELIVMGNNGNPVGFKKKFVGSNAYQVTKEAKEPVITINGDAKVTEIDKIIFPYMLGRKSKEKVGLCLHYARVFGSEVSIVALADDMKEQKQLPLHIKQIQKYITDHGVTCDSHIEMNEGRSYHQAFLDYSKKINGDMIIIMEDESVAPFHLWPSDLEHVMYNAEIPLLCVRPSPAKYGAGFSNF